MTLRTILGLLGFCMALLPACTKSVNPDTPASVVVVNAIPTSSSLYIVFSNDAPKYFKSAQSVYYESAILYSPPAGTQPVSVTQDTDTTRRIFTSSLQLASGGIYSLFFSGDTTRPDSMLVRDNIVNYSADSAGVRFVNLSAGAKSLSVNLEGGNPGDFGILSYKGMTPFKAFIAGNNGPGGYNFEIRDQASGDILATFTWYYTTHKNNTVVIAGSPDPSSPTPLTVFQVNNY